MKDAGLLWEPQVGCFVWDRSQTIDAPSPFGENIIMSLSSDHSSGNLVQPKRRLKVLCGFLNGIRRCGSVNASGIDHDAIASVSKDINPTEAGNILLALYRLILVTLENNKKLHSHVNLQTDNPLLAACGPLDDIEACPVDWETDLRNHIQSLFLSRRLAVLATQREEKPYASLVAFAATDDLKTIIFATTRSTRKFGYLSSNPAVALLIDDRTNEASDFRNAMAVTATGKAKEVMAPRRTAPFNSTLPNILT